MKYHSLCSYKVKFKDKENVFDTGKMMLLMGSSLGLTLLSHTRDQQFSLSTIVSFTNIFITQIWPNRYAAGNISDGTYCP